MKKNIFDNEFYCLQCGQKGLPIIRNKGFLKEKFHRKKLYCIHCKTEVNHIEVRNSEEKKEFLRNFRKGVYIDEAEKSISYVRGAGQW